MANKSRGTWYVSFELRQLRRTHTRATETFPNEREAKKFARAKLVEAPNVTAGTLNPHLPKRTIAATQMLEWLEEPDEAGLAGTGLPSAHNSQGRARHSIGGKAGRRLVDLGLQVKRENM